MRGQKHDGLQRDVRQDGRGEVAAGEASIALLYPSPILFFLFLFSTSSSVSRRALRVMFVLRVYSIAERETVAPSEQGWTPTAIVAIFFRGL